MVKRHWKECSLAESELEIDVEDIPTRPDAHRSGVMLKTRIEKYNEELELIILGYLFE